MTDGVHKGLYGCLFTKQYINIKHAKCFLEQDLFIRKWWLDSKSISYRNVEGYSFDGVRTEEIWVYGIKLLFGRVNYLTKPSAKYKPYWEYFGGVSVRNKISVYITENGSVNYTYYDYLKENIHEFFPAIQLGFRLGVKF